MTNLGQHSQDLVHWFMGVEAPKSVYSHGGRRYLKDICDTPDTQDVIFEYPGFQVVVQYREATAGKGGVGMGGLVFYGTKGLMTVGRNGCDAKADYVSHIRNFLDCVKSRQDPAVNAEAGHRVATSCHLANISMRVGRKIVWDSEKEEIVGDPAASKMLVRPYRAPCDSEFRSLGIAT